jgi:hypothetical protein
VTEALQQGVIPIVTTESGIDVKNFGIKLASHEVGEVKKTVEAASAMESGRLAEMSAVALKAAATDYSEDAFVAKFKEALERLYRESRS